MARLVDLKGERTGVREFRGQAAYYLKGIPRAAKVKVALMEAEEQATMNKLFDQLIDQYHERMNQTK